MYYVLSAVLRTLFHLIYSLILSQFETWEMLNSQNLSNLGKFTKLVSVVIQSQLSDSKSPLSINVLHQFSKKEAVALRYYSQGRLYRRQQRVTTFRNKKTKAGHSRKEKGGAGVEKFFFFPLGQVIDTGYLWLYITFVTVMWLVKKNGISIPGLAQNTFFHLQVRFKRADKEN